MRPFAFIFSYVIAGLVLILFAVWLFVVAVYPSVGPSPTFTVDATPERMERGRYLVDNVTQCFACHGTLQTHLPGAPVLEEHNGAAGMAWTTREDGVITAPNISPTGVAKWSDGELARAIFLGVNPDGNALRPTMPYPHYGFMCLEDRLSVITYVRSIPPVTGESRSAPPSYIESLLLSIIPREDPVPACDPELSGVDKGTYLTTIAGCSTCHTPSRVGVPNLARAFAGGTPFRVGGQTVRSSNLTPDVETGIGRWSAEDFVERFARHRAMGASDKTGAPRHTPSLFPHVKQPPVLDPMPWSGYAGLRDDDLEAIFLYLQTLPAVRNDDAPASSPHR